MQMWPGTAGRISTLHRVEADGRRCGQGEGLAAPRQTGPSQAAVGVKPRAGPRLVHSKCSINLCLPGLWGITLFLYVPRALGSRACCSVCVCAGGAGCPWPGQCLCPQQGLRGRESTRQGFLPGGPTPSVAEESRSMALLGSTPQRKWSPVPFAWACRLSPSLAELPDPGLSPLVWLRPLTHTGNSCRGEVIPCPCRERQVARDLRDFWTGPCVLF